MGKTFINEMQEGTTVESIFLCSHKALLTDKNGKPYLNLQLLDRSGTLEARIWDKAPLLSQKFEKGDYVWIKGNVVFFKDHLQLNILNIQQAPQEKINADHFLPHTKKDIDKMYEELLAICREEIKDPFVQKLLLSILEDPQMGPAFKRVPAAKMHHHAWIGGLLEHVLTLCKVAKDVLKHYPQVNGNLVIAGLILHDFGKIEEIGTDRFFEYSDKGKLIGHLTIGIEIILRTAAQIPDFPPSLLYQLEHIVLAHHGRLEYGSPKVPMTLEALMVHHLDNMDSKIQGFLDIVERDSGGDDTWTSPNTLFGNPLYKGNLIDTQKIPRPPASPKSPPPPEQKIAKARKPGFEKTQKKKPYARGPLKTNLGDLLNQQIKNGS